LKVEDCIQCFSGGGAERPTEKKLCPSLDLVKDLKVTFHFYGRSPDDVSVEKNVPYYYGVQTSFLPIAFVQSAMAALRVRSVMMSVQLSFLSRMTPKYFVWLQRVRRVWCRFRRVRLGILYFLVNRTSSFFSGLTFRCSRRNIIRLQRV